MDSSEFRDRTKKLGLLEIKLTDLLPRTTIYWLEILQDTGLLISEQIVNVKKEAKEILAMVVASVNTKLKNLKS